MTGYVRQSAADIVPTGVVRAAPINNELNALRDAFATAGGHKHDGTAAEGHPVPVIGDSDLLNKIATDTGNNRHGVFVEVGGVAVEQVRFQDGAIVPVTDNDVDLGTSSLEFKDLHIDGTANIDSLVADTADINGGTVDNAIIGATTPAASNFTTVSATGAITSTVSTGTAPLVIASTTKVSNLNVDQLDGADWAAPAAIGTSTPAAGTFTSLTANTSLVAATADINGGTLDGAVIGASSAQAITGTTVTATTGFVGGLTGNVTGNTTGTHTGAVIGNVTGDVTGNVTASSGSSSFNDVVINGGLNMNAGTSATITNLTSPTNTNDAATKGYVDTSIANLIDSAPGALDTLNELAAALGDDASFSTTVTNSIATKLALAGGTMSGAIAMGTNKITGLGNPTANQDAATKTYVDTADALKLSLTGGTMSGAIAMGTSKITGLGTPTDNADATTKLYVDGILGSATSAAASAAAAAVSASNAATSESNASTSASNASTSASNAATSATNAAASYDAFDDRYLGSKTSAPTLDNDGNALLTGALYWNSTSSELYLWTGSAWTRSALSGTDYVAKSGDTMTGALTTTALTLSGGTANGVAYLNGSKVLTSGSALTFDGSSLSIVGGNATINKSTNTSVLTMGGSPSANWEGDIRFLTSNTQTNWRISSNQVTAGSFTITPSTTGGGSTFTTPALIVNSSSNVGIGTSSPDNKLVVNGALAFSYTGSLSANGIKLNAVKTEYFNTITSTSSDVIHDFTGFSGASKLVITQGGNVGIGTSSPSNKLVVSNAGANGLEFNPTNGQIVTYNRSTSAYSALTLSGLSFTVQTGASPADRLTVDSSGNVGIGTSSPNILGFSKALTINNATGSVASEFAIGGAVQGWVGSSAAQTQFGSYANIPVTFWTNNTERMRLDSAGNLGLGVTPSAWAAAYKAIQLTDGAAFSEGGGNTYVSNNWFYDGTNKYIANGAAAVYGQSGGSHQWFTAASGTAGNAITFTQAMTLDASGNLGVGVTSPSGRLDIGGSGSTKLFVRDKSDSDRGIYLDSGTAATGVALVSTNTANRALGFATNDTERARINSSGAWSFGSSGTNTGTSGQVLTSQGSGSAPTWATAGGGSWTYLSTVTASGAATADIETTFDSTYDMYALVGVDVYPSTNAVNIYCRLKVGGTYRTTSYSRLTYGNNTNSGGTAPLSQGVAQTYILMNTTTTGGTGVVYNGAEDAGFFIMYIQKPARTSANQSVFGQYIYTPEDAGSTLTQGTFAGAYKGGYGALTGVRFLASSGNINGTFRLYGIKNS